MKMNKQSALIITVVVFIVGFEWNVCADDNHATRNRLQPLCSRIIPKDDSNIVPAEVEGLQGKAWLFDGKNRCLKIVPPKQMEAAESLTLACWIKLDALLPTSSRTVSSGKGKYSKGKRPELILQSRSHTILSWEGKDDLERRFFVVRPKYKGLSYHLGYSDGKKTFLTNGPGMTAGMWYHVAMAVGDGKVAFYLDGLPFHEQSVQDLLPAGLSVVRLGTDRNGDAPFTGLIEAVETSPELLAKEQIAAYYRNILDSAHIEANRKRLLADFPGVEEQLDNNESQWSRVLTPPYWYSKAWNWNLAWDWPEHDGDAVTIIAAADSPDKEGAHVCCDGTADDIPIQRALDELPESGGKVVFREGTYILTNAIMPKNHTELEILGTLKVADAVTSKLTQDTMKGDSLFHVADASRFRAGQWVTVVDDYKVDHKGGWENAPGGRKYGECARIESIDGKVIHLDGVFNRHANWHWWNKSPDYRKDYLVAGNAFVTTSHSAILVEGQSFVYIHGPGRVSGNRANQSRTAPLSTQEGGEEMRANSGIVVYDSSFVRVEGLTVHDANLHNVSFRYAENCDATDLETFGCNDKNIISVRTSRLRLYNNYAHNSILEDGIIFYTSGHMPLVGMNRIIDNHRYGFHVNASCRFVTSVRNTMRGNGRDTTLSENDARRSFSIQDSIGK